MNNKTTKLDNLKAELKKSKNIDDKIVLIKLKQRDNSFAFFESIKTLMKKS
jgi:hypothetical protein